MNLINQEVNNNGKTTINTYWDKSSKMRIIHRATRRGGCLYAGEITAVNKVNNRMASIDTTAAADTDETTMAYLLGVAKKLTA